MSHLLAVYDGLGAVHLLLAEVQGRLVVPDLPVRGLQPLLQRGPLGRPQPLQQRVPGPRPLLPQLHITTSSTDY